ncbi:MAG: flagellar assembly protein FliW [Lachnospiraceae bacterium]|nr:flagellar assembly protein FliW [Candidatus Colinaster scatohippi]
MKITTRVFGEVDIEDSKIINFPGGIVGFPDLTDFALIHDADEDSNTPVRWMQSIQEPNFAMPVMDPLAICEDYNPVVEDELLKPIGNIDPESVLVLVTLTVPRDIKQMSVNLQAPFVINADERKAVQLIVDSEKYPIRYKIYDKLKKED